MLSVGSLRPFRMSTFGQGSIKLLSYYRRESYGEMALLLRTFKAQAVIIMRADPSALHDIALSLQTVVNVIRHNSVFPADFLPANDAVDVLVEQYWASRR